MTSVPPFALEICIVCVGIFLLMMDCFTKLDKRSIGLAAIAGLLAVFVLSFLTGPMPSHVIPQGFYVADAPALFFKRFVLLSTVVTIALALDYAPVYERFIPSGSPQAGVGEFFILPVFTCAGLMWMVSAADFIMIFVSLELVTVTFYVLVASMRKNTGSLEAGVKYLILGALSTGFIVYGITWIFGVTGQTSLDGIRQTLPLLAEGSQAACTLRARARARRAGFQDRCGPVSILGARRVPRSADPDHGISLGRLEGSGFYRAA